MIEKETAGSRIFSVFNYFLLGAVGIVCLYPFYYVVMASFSDANEFIRHDFVLLFKSAGFSLLGYGRVFTKDLATGYFNTLFYVVAGTAISMLLSFLGAYVLSRKNYLFKRPLTLFIMFTMYFNGGLIPLYLWINQLGLLDTRWAILLPTAINTYNMIVMRTAFAGIPDGLVEAAKLDGASEFSILFKIVIPLCKPTIAVVVLFYAVARWNEWLPATMFLRTRTLYPLQIFLREILLTSSTDTALSSGGNAVNAIGMSEIIKYATIVVSTVPVLVIYPFIQKYFVSGVMIGGVKE